MINYKKSEFYKKIEKKNEAKIKKLELKNLNDIKKRFISSFRSLYAGPIISFSNISDSVINLLIEEFAMDELAIDGIIDLLKVSMPKVKSEKGKDESLSQIQCIDFIIKEKKLNKIYDEYFNVKKAKEIKTVNHSNPSAHIITVGMGKR